MYIFGRKEISTTFPEKNRTEEEEEGKFREIISNIGRGIYIIESFSREYATRSCAVRALFHRIAPRTTPPFPPPQAIDVRFPSHPVHRCRGVETAAVASAAIFAHHRLPDRTVYQKMENVYSEEGNAKTVWITFQQRNAHVRARFYFSDFHLFIELLITGYHPLLFSSKYTYSRCFYVISGIKNCGRAHLQ